MTNPIPECSDEVAALRAQVARLSEALREFCASWIVCTCRQSIHPALGLDPSCNYHNWHDEIDAGRKALSAVPSDLLAEWRSGQEASELLDNAPCNIDLLFQDSGDWWMSQRRPGGEYVFVGTYPTLREALRAAEGKDMRGDRPTPRLVSALPDTLRGRQC